MTQLVASLHQLCYSVVLKKKPGEIMGFLEKSLFLEEVFKNQAPCNFVLRSIARVFRAVVISIFTTTAIIY